MGIAVSWNQMHGVRCYRRGGGDHLVYINNVNIKGRGKGLVCVWGWGVGALDTRTNLHAGKDALHDI